MRLIGVLCALILLISFACDKEENRFENCNPNEGYCAGLGFDVSTKED